MADPTCVCGCDRPTPDGYAATACTERARRQLAEIAELTEEARAVAYGLVRRSGAGGSNKPGSRSPGNDDALDALNGIQNTITTIARDIAETRGAEIASAGSGDRGEPDPLVMACSWLSDQLEWVRHAVDDQGGPYAVTVLAEIKDSASRMWGIVNGPGARKFLGPCGQRLCSLCGEVEDHHVCEGDIPVWTCEGDVYGRPGADKGRCRTCGAQHDQEPRRRWLDDQTADMVAPARDIAHALSLPVKTIRTWATTIRTEIGVVLRAAKLRTFWRDGDHLEPWAERPDGVSDQAWKAETARRGPRLHFVGDVRELAEQAAQRRAARQAAEMGA